jgi:hypothetical protein
MHILINYLRSKIPSKKSRPYVYDVKFPALLGAPYIYNISRLRVKVKQNNRVLAVMLRSSKRVLWVMGMMTVEISACLCLLLYFPEPPSGLVFLPQAYVTSGCYHIHSATNINEKRISGWLKESARQCCEGEV